MSRHARSRHVGSHYGILQHATSRCGLSRHVTTYLHMSRYVSSFYDLSGKVTPHCDLSHHITMCHDTPRYAPRYDMPREVAYDHFALQHGTPYHMSRYITLRSCCCMSPSEQAPMTCSFYNFRQAFSHSGKTLIVSPISSPKLQELTSRYDMSQSYVTSHYDISHHMSRDGTSHLASPIRVAGIFASLLFFFCLF